MRSASSQSVPERPRASQGVPGRPRASQESPRLVTDEVYSIQYLPCLFHRVCPALQLARKRHDSSVASLPLLLQRGTADEFKTQIDTHLGVPSAARLLPRGTGADGHDSSDTIR